MPPWAWWIVFAFASLALIVGAKVLDDRDRRRFGASGPAVPGSRERVTTVPPSDPPSGAHVDAVPAEGAPPLDPPADRGPPRGSIS
jgi:hypothetical protein